jgi:protein translocase SEC61 complex gamma subunit
VKKLNEFISRCLRILHIAKKPTRKELEEIMRITSFGVLLIGVIGVVIYMVFSVL